MNTVLLFFTFVIPIVIGGNSDPFTVPLSDIYITNLELTKCNANSVDPVSVENVTVQMGNSGHMHITGTLSTSEDLVSPIKAAVILKKKVMFAWIEVPCEKKIGSCDYDDLCSFGSPANKVCPPEFIKNGVPCRCPIKKGTYTLPPSTFQLEDDLTDLPVLKGKYKGNIFITHLSSTLACYNIKFVLQKK